MSGFIIFIILLLTGLALFGAIRLRQHLLQERLQLEIANEGNTASRYRLRAEHPERLLTFRCSGQDLHIARDIPQPPNELILAESLVEPAAEPQDEPLVDEPERVPVAAPEREGLGARLSQGLQASRRLSSGLSSLGTMLPRPLKSPVMRIASRLQGVQMRASYAQRQPQMMARHIRSRPQQFVRSQAQRPSQMLARHVQQQPQPVAVQRAGSIPGRPNPIPAHQLLDPVRLARRIWVETPQLAPGEAMKLQIQVFSSVWDKGQEYTFRVLSHAVESPASPWVVTEVSVRIRGGFWAHPYGPLLVILAAAALALVLFM